VRRWGELRPGGDQLGWPDANLEWLWYQTAFGAWPVSAERGIAYLAKAAREAKVHTSWLDPVAEYDDAVAGFVRWFSDDAAAQQALDAFVQPRLRPGWTNSLALKLLTLTAPGVPDIYQGSELWDLSLVDPDNRRAVDFDIRRSLLDGLDPGCWQADPAGGAPKLLVVARTLALRERHPEWFGPGGTGRYEPLAASGPAAGHVVAFARGGAAVTVVPRLPLRLAEIGGWSSTVLHLPPGHWRDVFTGGSASGRAPLARLLAVFPVALLVRSRS
jgi:(1->4)-alpha-D-glucan 1-alpha-D-glucosylmutase